MDLSPLAFRILPALDKLGKIGAVLHQFPVFSLANDLPLPKNDKPVKASDRTDPVSYGNDGTAF